MVEVRGGRRGGGGAGTRSVFCAGAVWASRCRRAPSRRLLTEAASALTPHGEPLRRRTQATSSRWLKSGSINALPPPPPPPRRTELVWPRFQIITTLKMQLVRCFFPSPPIAEVMALAHYSNFPGLFLPLMDCNFKTILPRLGIAKEQPSSVKLFRCG